MKTCDKVMYLGSSGLSVLALAAYLFFMPSPLRAQCNGCVDNQRNCVPVGSCDFQFCGTNPPTVGMLCEQVNGTYQWGPCGSCHY